MRPDRVYIIIFWNYLKLAQKLRDDELTPTSKFYYIFCSAIFTVFIIECSSLYQDTEDTNIINVLNVIISVLFTGFTCFMGYQINTQGDNKNFIERYICLYLPITVRLVVIFYPIILLLFLYIDTPPKLQSQDTHELWVIFLIERVMEIYTLYCFCNGIRVASSSSK